MPARDEESPCGSATVAVAISKPRFLSACGAGISPGGAPDTPGHPHRPSEPIESKGSDIQNDTDCDLAQADESLKDSAGKEEEEDAADEKGDE